jgi:UDP-glucose 4-epimerase
MSEHTHPEAVLVTGGTGLIGAEVARSLLARGIRPILFDAAPNADNIADIADRVTQVTGDVAVRADVESAIAMTRGGHVIHLASMLGTTTSRDPARGVAVNSIGTEIVFAAAHAAGVRRVVWASSQSVYGRRDQYERLLGRGTVTEDDPPIPRDVYGGTKLLSELLAEHHAARGLDVVGLRPVLTIGPAQQRGAVGDLVGAWRDAVVLGAGVVRAPWSPHGLVNPIHVHDCAELFVATCLHPRALRRLVYNTGTGEYRSVGDMCRLADAIVPGSSITYEPGDALTASLPAYDFADVDSSALRNELGWTARHDLDSALRLCAEHWLQTAAVH